MVTSLLMRGLLVGFVAGILAFGFAHTFGEPAVDRAIIFEEQLSRARGEPPEPVLVSRRIQAGIGLFTGVVVYGTALGGLFALVFTIAYGRLGACDPRTTAALLALAGFLVVIVVPALKYPPNPPAIGDPATIGRRTALYFTALAVSLAAAIVAINAGQRLSRRFGPWNGTLLAILGFIAVVAAVQYWLPAVNEVPARFPAVVLWRFRIASLGIQAVLWATLGAGFGLAADRYLASPHLSRLASRAEFR